MRHAQQRLFRALDWWASTPTAEEHELQGEHDRRATDPVSVHALQATLNRETIRHFEFEKHEERVDAVVVIGSMFPGNKLRPLAACPIYIDRFADGTGEISVKPFAVPMIYPGQMNKHLTGEEREDFELMDIPLSLSPEWSSFWTAFQDEVKRWIGDNYGADVDDLNEFTVRTNDSDNRIFAWIERSTSTIYPSSLKSLTKLSRVRPDRVTGAARLLTSPPPALEPLGESVMKSVRSGKHMCHTDTTFPLDPFQSKAAVNIAALDQVGQDIWVQSVNGPPGTGKTSMMKSVISDAILRKVRDGKPARMLICGPTHQASNNLLGAITYDWEKALLPSGAPHPLAARWLPLGDAIGAQNAISATLKDGVETTDGPSILNFISSKQAVGENIKKVELSGAGRRLAYSMDLEPFIELFTVEGRLKVATDSALSAARESLSKMRAGAPRNIGSGLTGLDAVAEHLLGMLDKSADAIKTIHDDTAELSSLASSILGEIADLRGRGYRELKLKNLWPMAADGSLAQMPGRIASDLSALSERLAALKTRLQDLAHLDDPALAKIPAGILTAPVEQDLTDLPAMADRLLDTRQRYECFLITFRLAEIEALRTIHAYRDAVKKRRSKSKVRALLQDALAFALPVRAMTTHSAGAKAEPHFGTAADIVIIDEAGQMGPEFIPGIAAEADRVLAVGDPFQIPPILKRSPMLRKFAECADLPDLLRSHAAVWTHEDQPLEPEATLPEKGANGISIIEAHAPWRGEHAPVLQGHYRCPESIISISNLVTYQPRGIPLVPHIEDPGIAAGDLPIIGSLIHEVEPEGTTENWFEADMIARWTAKRLPDILALAKKGDEPVVIERDIELMKKAIAFISPFRNQADKLPAKGSRKTDIQNRLGEKVDNVYVGLLPNLMRYHLIKEYPFLKRLVEDKRKAKKNGPVRKRRLVDIIIGGKKDGVVFGTIHALQGAECPVVVLSCVSSQKSDFFDKDPSLTNVGVSRSKRSLILAHHEEFGIASSPDMPSSILRGEAQRYRVVWPERVVMVEAPDEVAPIQEVLGPSTRVIATGGPIARSTGVDADGNVIKEWDESASLHDAKRWMAPVDQGGRGVKELVIATSDTPDGHTIGEDVVDYLDLLDPDAPEEREITLSRWPLTSAPRDPSEIEALFKARAPYTPGITDARSAKTARLRTLLRTALTRSIAEKIAGPSGSPDPWVALFMKEMLADEVPGLAVRVTAEDENGRHLRAILQGPQGEIIRFPISQEANNFISEKTGAEGILVNAPLKLPFPDKRDSFDMAILGSWLGLQPHEVMQILKGFYDGSPETSSVEAAE